ncbi:MAG: NYN domain-containing protein [Gemmatimonadetes bacterium]|nr:NYN domain-containing protein [Gemmatimonadota bacterium]
MRVAFIVDGYNLYHSIRDAEKVVADRPMRWLDLSSLCCSYLHHFGRNATLQGVYYFSAVPRHLAATKLDIEARHEVYVDALCSTGVVVSLGNFKAREKHIPLKYCRFKLWPMRRPIRLPIPRCSLIFTRSEEKETDVAIASKMFELLHLGVADAVVLISGDTDLIPAIRTAGQLFPAARTAVMFPYNRHNAELKRAVRHSFKISKDKYAKHQLPDPIVLPNGYVLRKPPKW